MNTGTWEPPSYIDFSCGICSAPLVMKPLLVGDPRIAGVCGEHGRVVVADFTHMGRTAGEKTT